jgi:hypothetical protein
MTLEELLIAIVRILGSLPVLFFPFGGALLAVAVDQSDLFIMNLVHLGGVRDYQVLDKYLDQVYLFAFLVVSQRWSPRLRAISIALYLYRLVGFVTFELTEARWVLLAFPNFFEFWFLGVAGLKQFHLDQRLNKLQLGSLAGVFIAGKIFQEYAIHYRRWLDGFTAVEAVQSVWHWLTHPF